MHLQRTKMNRITIIGRLVADPELRYTQNGTPVCSIRIAVDRKYKDQSGEKPTDFFSCNAWRKAGELINQYTKKGDMIAVDGEMQSRKWQDKEGNNKFSWDINVENFKFLNSKSGSNNSNKATTGDNNAPPQNDEDLPF